MIGKTVSHYQVIEKLGAGGMGEVYRAHDTTLDRQVAIKILPDIFSGDPERLARFEREAKLLASLNHPNIASIYGLEQAEGKRLLVMELVEGETLAQRIAKGALAMDEALQICRQIAEGFEAAHEKGVIHRDLKPANIKITPEGKVKILDFGLAKALAGETQSADSSQSPTIKEGMTRPGVVLGTAAYMSPEQAKGKAVDKRADIWAFGCILYECLTGKRPFEGETVTEAMAAILMREPNWQALPETAPPIIRRLLRHCLIKDPRQRLDSIVAARIEIDEGLAPAQPEEAARAGAAAPTRWTRRERRMLAVTALALLVIVAGAVVALLLNRPVPVPGVVRFSVTPPEGTVLAFGISTSSSSGVISPDGQRLAFTAKKSGDSASLLWIRALDALAAQSMPGTEGAYLPFWSPDSRWVAFFAYGKLKKIDVTGGPVQTLCDAPTGRGGSWSQDGVIIFAPDSYVPLSRVSASGGAVVPVTKLPASQLQTGHRFPSFLPDGKHFIYTLYTYGGTGAVASYEVFLGDLNSPDTNSLLKADSAALFSPAGYLLFVRQDSLLAQEFDPKTFRLSGDAVPLAEQVKTSTISAPASVSANGTLVYHTISGNQDLQLAWLDREGRVVDSLGSPGPYCGVEVSADGKKVAVHRHEGPGGDIWLMESQGPVSRFTFDPTQDNCNPIWSPDGTRLAFGSWRDGKWGIYQKRADGTSAEEQLLQLDTASPPLMAWSPNGRFIVYSLSNPKTGNDLWVLPLTGDRKPFPIVVAPASQVFSAISPDGKWIAYGSNEDGRRQNYVKPFPAGEGRWQITTQGSATFSVRWSGDGKELFYMAPDNTTMMAVPVFNSDANFQWGTPKELFDSHYASPVFTAGHAFHDFAVTPNGQRFLIPQGASAKPEPMRVVLNWTSLLKR